MPFALGALQCGKCQASFAQKSSLVRHSKRCLADIPRPLRQKSCIQCSDAKARCSLKRPRCSRCVSKQLSCQYMQAQQDEEAKESSTETYRSTDRTLVDSERSKITPPMAHTAYSNDCSSNDSSYTPFGTVIAVPDSPPLSIDQGPVARLPGLIRRAVTTQQHGLNHTIRILRTYPLMVAHRTQLPPFIHHLQLSEGLPLPLTKCYDILASWEGYTSQSAAVADSILAEIDRLVKSACASNENDLLASVQAMIIYAIILLFPRSGSIYPHVNEEYLILSFQEFTLRLAAAGFSLEEETEGRIPDLRQWAFISAKRRSVLAAYIVTWAWSVLRGYPTFHCRELGFMLAPAAKLLWQARSREDWLLYYAAWLSRWQDNGYKIGETFVIPPNDDLDLRTQAWLEEVDEFGMLLMSQVNAV